jgi:hypothetical protein
MYGGSVHHRSRTFAIVRCGVEPDRESFARRVHLGHTRASAGDL